MATFLEKCAKQEIFELKSLSAKRQYPKDGKTKRRRSALPRDGKESWPSQGWERILNCRPKKTENKRITWVKSMDMGVTRTSRLLFCASLIVSCILAYQIASWAAQSLRPRPESPPKNEIAPRTLLIPSSSKIDLGRVPRGGRKEEAIHLSNKGNETVEIANIEISCDCVQLRLPSRLFEPSQEIEADLIADFSSDPNFTGRLGIEVNARTPTGALAFALVVYVNVFQNSDSERRSL